MKTFLSIIIVLSAITASVAQEITTFILVRHAEKASADADTELSVQGIERAEKLSSLLKNASITAVYSTKYKRTQNTVSPTAKAKNLTVNTYDKLDVAALQELAKKYPGGTILIAGHSNTVPVIANALLGKNEFQNFPDSEYGNILVISVKEVGKSASVLTLNY
jgi:2,3-bisphosphoglycerate-dependent phosphoglycerate mutase